MIDALATLAGTGRVLEMGIGTGRVALPLVARGVHLEGIDISPEMVERLRAKPGGAEIAVTIGSFADVPLEGRYDLVILVFNTIYMLQTAEEQQRCFEHVAEHLRPGGAFVIEAFILDEHAAAKRKRGKRDTSHYDVATQRLTLDYLGSGEGVLRAYSVDLRYAPPAELDRMARAAGLQLAGRWRDWEANPFTELSSEHVSLYTR
ncbi:MAG: class I SAM-dependent methyltransferase [Chloroflexi bacterium]|nr:MAG: class I SAM-dependent methyltransferase [Chloroflexota bacterium]